MQSLVLDFEYKKRAIGTLVDDTHHHRDFYMLLIGAVLLSIWGIFTDSIPVLIASLIVVPLAYPMLGLRLGVKVGDWRLSMYTLLLLVVACLLALTISVGASLLLNDARVQDVYAGFTENHILAAVIAIALGIVGGYGLARPRVASAITGAAIALLLAPSLIATGIGLSASDSTLTSNAFTLLLLSVAGILIAGIIVFQMFNIRHAVDSKA